MEEKKRKCIFSHAKVSVGHGRESSHEHMRGERAEDSCLTYRNEKEKRVLLLFAVQRPCVGRSEEDSAHCNRISKQKYTELSQIENSCRRFLFVCLAEDKQKIYSTCHCH